MCKRENNNTSWGISSEQARCEMLFACRDILVSSINTICCYLLKFVGDHSESLEDGVCGSSDGDDPLWTVALGNIDPCSALRKHMHVVNGIDAMDPFIHPPPTKCTYVYCTYWSIHLCWRFLSSFNNILCDWDLHSPLLSSFSLFLLSVKWSNESNENMVQYKLCSKVRARVILKWN